MKSIQQHLLGTLSALIAWLPTAHADDARVLEALRGGGVVILLRHATTEPGIGDPPGFTLGNCSTQRNLSASGRDEARRFGAALRAAGVKVAAVRSSRWCRCLDTARLAFPKLGIQPWQPLDSFFAGQGDRQRQTADALAALADWPTGHNELWVTHQVNISALTGTYMGMGEAVVARVRGGELEVIGQWRP
ncbi:MAG: histidine phosphatase family protein [Zoogloeaceae bacterium]|nr:histidine phosphatase family protein [Zoogloeaceae bacterium]